MKKRRWNKGKRERGKRKKKKTRTRDKEADRNQICYVILQAVLSSGWALGTGSASDLARAVPSPSCHPSNKLYQDWRSRKAGIVPQNALL